MATANGRQRRARASAMTISRMLDGELRDMRARMLTLQHANTRLKAMLVHLATHDGYMRSCETCAEIRAAWRNAGKVVD